MSYGIKIPDITQYRYLVKVKGKWFEHKTYARSPDWDNEVTDVIWRKSSNMVANWWQMRDGKKVDAYTVKDEDLTLILLAVEQ